MGANSKEITVTVGIPAYNEGKNIDGLIRSILDQRETGFLLEKVMVISDGSTDSTVEYVAALKDARVCVYGDKNRLGKPARINEIFEKSNTDVVVILDADIKIHSPKLLTNLLTPFVADEKVLAVSGVAEPLAPQNTMQKILTAGWEMWKVLRNRPDAELYRSEGPIRAFRRDLYGVMRFPNASADDAFSYLYCKKHNHPFAFAPEATVFYSLPTSLGDYIKQHTRFLSSKQIQVQVFDREFVEKFYVITPKLKLYSFFIYAIKKPFLAFLYLIALSIPKVIFLFKPLESSATWRIASSTKVNYGETRQTI